MPVAVEVAVGVTEGGTPSKCSAISDLHSSSHSLAPAPPYDVPALLPRAGKGIALDTSTLGYENIRPRVCQGLQWDVGRAGG